MPNSPTLPHCTPRALCSSVQKNADSLVKEMTLCAQGGGGGGKRSWSKSLPPISPWSACFLLLLREGFFLILFSRSQKYWRETHLLDPLVLAPLAPLLQWLVSWCWLIALVLALQDWHACMLDKETFFDSLLVHNWKEDSIDHATIV